MEGIRVVGWQPKVEDESGDVHVEMKVMAEGQKYVDPESATSQ